MAKVKYKLKGHETFTIREGWIAKGIHAVHQNERVFSEHSGADVLGVGTNLAKAIRYWLKATGLTVEKPGKGVKLTELGEIIYQLDPYIEENFTLWCMHIGLATNQILATSWYLFFNRFVLEEFKKEEMYTFMEQAFRSYVGEEVAFSEKSLQADCTAILSMYAREQIAKSDPEDKKICPLSRLGLLHGNKNMYKRLQPDLSRFPIEIIWYLMQLCWYEEKSVSIEDFYEGENGVKKILGLSPAVYQECLDLLEKQDYITINRTSGLDMIYKNADQSSQQVAKAYYMSQNVTV
ncbi:MAG: DUF4007 family protein [Lachnospiraceae bacterium]|nr:DUF4007 family protein [Lachnospiraceae bacterium]